MSQRIFVPARRRAGMVRRRRLLAPVALLACAALTQVACVLPVTSSTPAREEGIIDDDILESLIGLDHDAVIERIGPADYSGPRARAHLMVYQGVKEYSTDIYYAVSAGYTGAAGKLDDAGGITRVFYCHVVELDESRIVRDYEVVARPASGISSRDNDDDGYGPVADCSEVVWKDDERGLVVASADERQGLAESAQTEVFVEVAGRRESLAAAHAMASEGDAAAAYALYEHYSMQPQRAAQAWQWLCEAASKGDAYAQAEAGYWFRTSVWQHSGDDRLASVRELGIEPDNRVAYKWYTLAASNGDAGAMDTRKYVIEDMRPGEIDEAEQMVRDWRPGDCPSAKKRLTSPRGS